MSYIDAIKDGCTVVYRNWQLVLLQLCFVIVTGIGFFIFAGIPLAIAFVILGTDTSELLEMRNIPVVLRDPSHILSEYSGLFFLVIACILVYILVAMTFSIYVFGGTVGVISRAFTDRTLKFTMHRFFSEARRLFFPILGFTAFIGLVIIALFLLLVIFGAGIAAGVSLAKSQDTTLALFLGTFFTLLFILITFIFILGMISVTLYGLAELSFKNTGPMKSFKEALNYLVRHPKALWFYPLLLVLYVLINFTIALFGYPFSLIPVVGPILLLPYQLLSYVFLTYVGIAMIAAVFAYYYSTEILGGSEVPSKSLNALS